MDFKNYNTLPDVVVKPSSTTTLSSTTTISDQASKSKKGMPRSLGFLLMTLFSLAIFSTRCLSSTREHTTFKLAAVASTGSIVEAGAEQQGKKQNPTSKPTPQRYVYPTNAPSGTLAPTSFPTPFSTYFPQRPTQRPTHTYCDSTVTHPHHEYCPSGKKCPNCGSKRCVCPV